MITPRTWCAPVPSYAGAIRTWKYCTAGYGCDCQLPNRAGVTLIGHLLRPWPVPADLGCPVRSMHGVDPVDRRRCDRRTGVPVVPAEPGREPQAARDNRGRARF